MLLSPIDLGDLCFSNTLGAWDVDVESLVEDFLFHLNEEPMFCVKGNENLRFDVVSIAAVLVSLSLGLLVGLTLALAETVGLM